MAGHFPRHLDRQFQIVLAGVHVRRIQRALPQKRAGVIQAALARGYPSGKVPDLGNSLGRVGFSRGHGRTKDGAVIVENEFVAAEKLFGQSLAIRQKQDPDIWTTFHVQSLLGTAILGQKKYKDAEPILLAGYEGMRQRIATIPAKNRDLALQQGMGPLAELYEATREREETKLQGKLTEDKTQFVHQVDLTAGKAVVLLMNSSQFDTLLQVQDAKGKLLVENDDIEYAAKKTNSRIWFMPPADGTYRIVAGSFQDKGRGEYEIVIRQYKAEMRK